MAISSINSISSPGKSRKKWLLPLAAGFLLLSGASASVWFNPGSRADEASDAGRSEPEKPPVFVTIDPVTVNLQPEDDAKLLQVSLTVQLENQRQAELFKQYMPEVRSRLILLLSSKKASELLTADGKTKLSNDILAQMKQPMGIFDAPKNVVGVFFTSFFIQ